MSGGQHCVTPPGVIMWIGCLRGEHAGPLAYCAYHATAVPWRGLVLCAQCGGQVAVMKITSMDGVSVVACPDPPGPPPGHWRSVFSPP
jgi:hypothetical protein